MRIEDIRPYGSNFNFTIGGNKSNYQNIRQLPNDTFVLSTKQNDKIQQVQAPFSLTFRGMSKPAEYSNSIDYMAASIIDKNSDFVKVLGGKPIMAHKIKASVDKLFEAGVVFRSPAEVSLSKTKFPVGTDEQTRKNIKHCIDETRRNTMSIWEEILTTNARKIYTGGMDTSRLGHTEHFLQIYNGTRESSYFDRVKDNPILKFVIWESFMADMTEKNRHMPLPINPAVMQKTVEYFENLPSKEYSAKANGVSKFREKYQDELVNNAVECVLTNRNNEFSKIKTYGVDGKLIDIKARKNLNPEELKGIWIEIPKRSRDTRHPDRNITVLEQLSHPNWCTKSRSNMAKTYLDCGNFLLYLEYDSKNKKWSPELGIPVLKSKNGQDMLYRINGKNNDNVIPLEHLDVIENLLESNKDRIVCCNDKADGEGEFSAKQLEKARLMKKQRIES